MRRKTARQGVVKNFTGGTGADDMAKLTDITKKQIGAITGQTYMKTLPPTPWKKGNAVISPSEARSPTC